MAQEGDQVGHLPRARKVDVRGGELVVAAGGGRVEDAQRGRDHGGYLAVGEVEEEALVPRPAGVGAACFLPPVLAHLTEDLGLAQEPGKAHVGGEPVEGADHVRVLHVVGVLVRHPFGVGEDGADGGAMAPDRGFVAADRLKGKDVFGGKVTFSGRVGCQAPGCARGIDIDELLLFFRAWRFGEYGALLVRQQRSSAVVQVLLVETHDFNVVGLGKGFDEGPCRVKGPCLGVCDDPFDCGRKVRITLDEMLTDLLGISGPRRGQVLEMVLVDGRLPLVQEFERAREAASIQLEFVQERPDVLVVLVIVGVDGAMSDQI